MGQLVDGQWTDENVISEIENGLYVKKPSKLRNFVTADGSSGFKAESGRYHLYASISCPWAHRAVLFRTLKNLQDHIGLTNTETTAAGGGWNFVGAEPHTVPGTDTKVRYLHEIYCLGDPGYTGKVTVPTLWDSEKCVIVNNESSEIIRMFNAEFSNIAGPSQDFYPEALRADIDEMNELILRGVNDAVNGCGRSSGQKAYEDSFDLLFSTLDHLEELLGARRYLCGETQTESDWRLFPSLVRFDAIYYIGYKCNRQRLSDYANLSNYLRDLYQTPGITACCDIETNKRLVFSPGGPIMTNGVIPKGPFIDLDQPHDRNRFAAAA